MEIAEVLQLTYQLRDLINTDERLTLLRAVEHQLDNDIEVIRLSQTMHRWADAYQAALDSQRLKTQTQRQLHQAKFELESHPLVRRYFEVYRPVRELYDKIQNELFAPFNLHMCGQER